MPRNARSAVVIAPRPSTAMAWASSIPMLNEDRENVVHHRCTRKPAMTAHPAATRQAGTILLPSPGREARNQMAVTAPSRTKHQTSESCGTPKSPCNGNHNTKATSRTNNPAARVLRSSGTSRRVASGTGFLAAVRGSSSSRRRSKPMRDAMVNYRPEPLTGGGDTRKYRVVSTRVVRSSRPGSTGFGGGRLNRFHEDPSSGPFPSLLCVACAGGERCVTGTIRLGQMGA